MGDPGARTFWATIDRISNQGNGVVEKDGGGHFIVGPVKEEAVGKTVEVRMVGENEAELVDLDLRKDIYAENPPNSNQELSKGDVVSGLITKRSPNGVPVLEQRGTRIEIPGAELNDRVEVAITSISESNPQWRIAKGKQIGEDDTGTDTGTVETVGAVLSEVELYDSPPTTKTSTSGEVSCPVSSCEYVNQPASVAGHVSGKKDSQHDWTDLGYKGATEYKKQMSREQTDLQSSTSILQISDCHLGASLTSTAEYSRENPCVKGFRRAVDIAIEREVDGVLNTGDLFHNDGQFGIPPTVEQAAEDQLQRLSDREVPFYSITGDHERTRGQEVLEAFQRDDLVIPLGETPELVGEGFALYGLDYAPQDEWMQIDWQSQPPSTTRYGIVGIHQSIAPISNSDNPDCTVTDLVSMLGPHIAVIATGHLHRAGISWHNDLPFVLGGTTEPQRAYWASIDPLVSLFTQKQGTLQYQRIALSI